MGRVPDSGLALNDRGNKWHKARLALRTLSNDQPRRTESRHLFIPDLRIFRKISKKGIEFEKIDEEL